MLLVGGAAVTAAAIVERRTGGLIIGDRFGRIISINHCMPEVLQPVLLFALAGAAGVAGGRMRRARVPLIIAGVLAAFMIGTLAWMFQWAPARYVTPLLTQPLRVPIELGGRSPANLPAGWVLAEPDQYNSGWQRVLVSPSMVAWHDVYLIGLIVVLAGLAVPSRRTRAFVALGAVIAIAGVVAQVLVAPGAISFTASGP